MKGFKNIAVIPIRANSTRFPGKHMAMLGSKRVVDYTIEFALNTPDLDAVIVITNDEEIAHHVRSFFPKVRLMNRPESISGSHIPTMEVLTYLDQTLAESYEHLVLLQATNPLRPANLLAEAFEELQRFKRSSLFTVSRNTHKLGRIADSKFEPDNYSFGQRSQDMEPLFYENGLLYIASAEMIKKGVLMNEESLPFLVDHPFGEIDIDEKEDLMKAAFYLQQYASE